MAADPSSVAWVPSLDRVRVVVFRGGSTGTKPRRFCRSGLRRCRREIAAEEEEAEWETSGLLQSICSLLSRGAQT